MIESTIAVEDGKSYWFYYTDHLGKIRECVGRVLRHYDAEPAAFIYPGRPRPIASVEVECRPEKVGSFSPATILDIALADIGAIQEQH